MNSRSGKSYKQFESEGLKRGFWGSTGLHLAALILLITVPVMLWWDDDPKTPPVISVDFSTTKAALDLEELEGLPMPIPEVEVVPPTDAEAFLVEAEMDEQLAPDSIPPRDATRPSPLESWPGNSAWVKDRSSYQGLEKPVVEPASAKPSAPEPAVTTPAFPTTPKPAAQTNAVDQPDPIPDPQASPRPTYPWQAVRRRLQGVVQVLVEVDSSGKVVSVRIAQTSGHGILDRAALDGVKKWKFKPAKKNGKAVPGAALVPIRFHFQNP